MVSATWLSRPIIIVALVALTPRPKTGVCAFLVKHVAGVSYNDENAPTHRARMPQYAGSVFFVYVIDSSYLTKDRSASRMSGSRAAAIASCPAVFG